MAIEAGIDVVEIDEAAEEQSSTGEKESENATWETRERGQADFWQRRMTRRAVFQRRCELRRVARKAGRHRRERRWTR